MPATSQPTTTSPAALSPADALALRILHTQAAQARKRALWTAPAWSRY